MTASAMIAGLIVALAFGVSIGSFLNVVIWRVPRGQSISSPTWSYCPNCNTRLGGWDLFPLLSFLLLGTKCRYCKKPISWRYITVEAITGGLYMGLFACYSYSIETVFYCLFASVLVASFFIDLDFFIIPDELNMLGVAMGIALNLIHYRIEPPAATWRIGMANVPASILSAIICALIFHSISLLGYMYYSGISGKRIGRFLGGIADDYLYLTAKFTGMGKLSPRVGRWIASHECDEDIAGASRDQIAAQIEEDDEQTGMGQGDAKLAAAIGSVLLLKLALTAIFIAIVLGGAVSVVLVLTSRRRGRSAIPFGPYLVAGAIIAMFCGQNLLNWYLNYAFPVAR